MNTFFTLLICMIFCHILDDYCLQGILASMKQKSWWKEHAPDKMYEYDYIAALIAHAFSWAFMIQLPILIYMRFNVDWVYFVMFILNVVGHACVDHMKANQRRINLIQDQKYHLLQIFTSALTFASWYINF